MGSGVRFPSLADLNMDAVAEKLAYAVEQSEVLVRDVKCLKDKVGALVKKVYSWSEPERPMIERQAVPGAHALTIMDIIHLIYQFIIEHLPFGMGAHNQD